MKEIICTLTGIGGAIIAGLFGGWSTGLATLVIVMTVDYITGLIVAGVFKASKKTQTGGLESKAGFKGLCRKGVILLIVAIAYRLDLTIGSSYVQDAVIIAFIVNEIISILENAGLMGIPMLPVMENALDMLTKKNNKTVPAEADEERKVE